MIDCGINLSNFHIRYRKKKLQIFDIKNMEKICPWPINLPFLAFKLSNLVYYEVKLYFSFWTLNISIFVEFLSSSPYCNLGHSLRSWLQLTIQFEKNYGLHDLRLFLRYMYMFISSLLSYLQ